MSRLTAARPQIATRLHSRSGNMHTVLLAEPQRVVRAGRSLLAEYKVSVIFQVSVTQAPAAQSTTKVRSARSRALYSQKRELYAWNDCVLPKALPKQVTAELTARLDAWAPCQALPPCQCAMPASRAPLLVALHACSMSIEHAVAVWECHCQCAVHSALSPESTAPLRLTQ